MKKKKTILNYWIKLFDGKEIVYEKKSNLDWNPHSPWQTTSLFLYNMSYSDMRKAILQCSYHTYLIYHLFLPRLEIFIIAVKLLIKIWKNSLRLLFLVFTGCKELDNIIEICVTFSFKKCIGWKRKGNYKLHGPTWGTVERQGKNYLLKFWYWWLSTYKMWFHLPMHMIFWDVSVL